MSAADAADASGVPPGVSPGARIVRVDVAGTVAFVIALAIAVPLREHRFAQYLVGAVSMVLFAIGVITTLWAYTRALERSRAEEVGVANLYLLTGATAPPRVKLTMLGALAMQVVAALAGASVGAAGLDKGDLNALAFGVLVPMFGIGLNGVWAARHGAYGPRLAKTVSSRDRRID
jgi:hypothetical protein